VDYEVPVPGLGRGCWAAGQRVLAGDRPEFGDGDLRNVTDEVWKKYIEDQKPEELDDNFKIV
jgi:hypothetical protein